MGTTEGKNGQVERLHFIDALRVVAILLMFFYHTAMIFVAEWDWHIKNSELSNVLMEINYWLALFRMPLLFLVSGYISCVLLAKFRWTGFIKLRFERLIIPTLIWTFLLVAPQIYFERRLQGQEFSYLEFYATFSQFDWWPAGNFHWLHLWFIPYLFVYNLASIPVYRMLQSVEVGQDNHTKVARLGNIFLYVLIAILPYTFLSTRYPATYDLIHDYARHAFFLFFILAGLLMARFPQIVTTIERSRGLFLQLAFAGLMIINIVRWNGWEPKLLWSDWLEQPMTYGFIGLLNLNSWLWVLALLGYGKRYLNKGSSLLSYCNKAVYPFYILHQTVIVVIGYYVVQTPDDAALKFLFLLLACFMVTGSLYHLYIRPFKFMRAAFGIK